MKKLKVAILFGGKSGEHEVSIVSAMSIRKALDPKKYDITMIGIDKTGRWLLPAQSELLAHRDNPRLMLLNKCKKTVGLLPFPAKKSLLPVETKGGKSSPMPSGFDVVLPILHGTYGEDGTIQGLLELANIPYVGSGVLGSSVGMDKDMTKRVLRDAGIPIVPFLAVRKHEFAERADKILREAEEKFGYPYFIKPANMGSSVGVHKVKSREKAAAQYKDAFKYDTKILVEQYIDGRELEVSVLGNENPKASCVGEIIPKHEFYSYEAKYIDENGADLNIPAKNLTAQEVAIIQKEAIATFKALECAGLARVDFFLDRRDGRIYLNEINTIPGFTSISMYPKLWEASGLPYAKLLDELIRLAIERHTEKNKLKTSFEVD